MMLVTAQPHSMSIKISLKEKHGVNIPGMQLSSSVVPLLEMGMSFKTGEKFKIRNKNGTEDFSVLESFCSSKAVILRGQNATLLGNGRPTVFVDSLPRFLFSSQ